MRKVTLHPGKFFTLLSSADFFQDQLFRKILSGLPSERQLVWTQIRSDVLLGLIWVQTICKSYEQTTLGDKEATLCLEPAALRFEKVSADSVQMIFSNF